LKSTLQRSERDIRKADFEHALTSPRAIHTVPSGTTIGAMKYHSRAMTPYCGLPLSHFIVRVGEVYLSASKRPSDQLQAGSMESVIAIAKTLLFFVGGMIFNDFSGRSLIIERLPNLLNFLFARPSFRCLNIRTVARISCVTKIPSQVCCSSMLIAWYSR